MEICTKDMYLAAAIVSYGSPIVGSDRSDPKRQYFHFDRLPETVYISDENGNPVPAKVESLEDIKSFYLSKKLFLLPSFVDCIRSVKSYIYSTE